jgi:hypothetical protein
MANYASCHWSNFSPPARKWFASGHPSAPCSNHLRWYGSLSWHRIIIRRDLTHDNHDIISLWQVNYKLLRKSTISTINVGHLDWTVLACPAFRLYQDQVAILFGTDNTSVVVVDVQNPILWSFKVSATVVSTFAWNSKRKIHEYTSVAAKVRDMISTKSYCKDFESTNTVGISQYLTEMNNSDAQLSHKSISGLCPVREISRPWKRSRSHLALTSLLLRPQELPVSNLWRVNKFNRTME